MIATVLSMVTSEEDEPTAPVGQLSPLKERLAERRRAREAQAARHWDPNQTRAGCPGFELLDEYTAECQTYLDIEVYNHSFITTELNDLFHGDTDPDMIKNMLGLFEHLTRDNMRHVDTTLESWPSEYIVALSHTLKFISIGFDFNKLEDGYVTGDYLESLGISLPEMEDDYNEDYGGHCLKVVERHMGHCYRIGFDNGKHLSTREEFSREFLQPNNAYDFTITSTITEC